MLDPLPVEVSGETEEEVEQTLQVMESDSTRYKPVKINAVIKQMERWSDDIDINHTFVTPEYEDEDYVEDEYLDSKGEVIDLVDFMNRNR